MKRLIFNFLLIFLLVFVFATLLRQAFFADSNPVTFQSSISILNQLNFDYATVLDNFRSLVELLQGFAKDIADFDLFGALVFLARSVLSILRLVFVFLYASALNGYEMVRLVFWLFTDSLLPALPTISG